MIDSDSFVSEKESSIEEFLVKKETITLSRIQKSIKKGFFNLLIKAFPLKDDNSYSNKTQMITMYLLILLETFQLLSLLWFPSESTKGWKNFKNFWIFLSFARMDNLCSTFSLIPTCFYISLSVCGIFLVLVLICLAFFLWSTKVDERFLTLTRKLMILISSIFCIPMITLQLLMFKSVLKDQNGEIIQYNSKVEYLNRIYAYLGLGFVVVLYACVYTYNALIFECRHKYDELSMYSRAYSKLEIIKTHFHILCIIFFVFFADTHQEIFRCLVAVTSGYLSYTYYKKQPFYSVHTNTAKITEYAIISVISLIFEFSYITNNSLHSFLLTVFVAPPLILLIFCRTFDSLSQDKPDVSLASDQFEFELFLRKELKKTEDPKKVINFFSSAYEKNRFGREPAMILWLSNFCYFSMEDDNLARIKLGTETNENNNLDIEFQIFRLKSLFLSSLEHEDISFLNFRSKLEKVKSDDELLCVALIEFLRNVQSGSDLKSLLTDLIPKISSLFSRIIQQYEDLVVSYPKSAVILALYGSFLENFLNQNEKAGELLRKMEQIKMKNELSSLRTISYFDEKNGLLIISGASDSFAKITYVNGTVAKILKQPDHAIVGNSISSYVPYPFNINHDYHMKKYIFSCVTPEIPLPLGLFLQTESGFLIECFVEVKCTALEKNPFFIVLMRERRSDREIAILKPNGLILNHSEKFSKTLGVEDFSLRERFIDEFLGGYTFQTMNENFPYILKINGVSVGLVRSYKLIKKRKVDIFYLVIDPHEINGWRRGLYSKEVRYNSDEKMDAANTYEEAAATKNSLARQELQLKALSKLSRKASTELKEKETVSRGSKYLKSHQLISHQLISPSLAPYRTIGSSSSGSLNNLSTSPKFVQAFSLLRKMKWIVLLFVLVTVSLQTASTIIITQKYNIKGIQDINDVGQMASLVAETAVVLRGLQLGSSDPYLSEDGREKMLEILNSYSNVQEDFKRIYSETSCNSKKIFPLINEYDPLYFTFTKKSMLNIIQKIKQALEEVNSGGTSPAYEYSVVNSLLLAQQLVKSYENIKKCMKSKVSDQGNLGLYLLTVSIGFSGLSFLFIIISWLRLKSLYRDIWIIFNKHANSHLPELCRRVGERLIEVHNQKEYKSFSPELIQKTKKSSEYFSFFQYTWRICLFLAILFSFFFIVFYQSIPGLIKITDLHPLSLIKTYNAETSTYFFNFWIREKVVNSIEKTYGKFYVFNGINENIENLRKTLSESQNFFLNGEFLGFIEKNTFETLHSNSLDHIGQYSLMNDLLMVSYDLDAHSDQEAFKKFNEKCGVYTKTMESFTTNLSDDIDSQHKNENKVILTYTLLYLFSEIIIFSFIFVSILSGDMSRIADIKKLGEFIPIKVSK